MSLDELLNPEDPLTIPQPGFPSFGELVAWAETQPRNDVVEAAIEVLRTGGWPQQYAAMGLLRTFGVHVEGEGHHEHFCWLVEVDDKQIVIRRPQD